MYFSSVEYILHNRLESVEFAFVHYKIEK